MLNDSLGMLIALLYLWATLTQNHWPVGGLCNCYKKFPFFFLFVAIGRGTRIELKLYKILSKSAWNSITLERILLISRIYFSDQLCKRKNYHFLRWNIRKLLNFEYKYFNISFSCQKSPRIKLIHFEWKFPKHILPMNLYGNKLVDFFCIWIY